MRFTTAIALAQVAAASAAAVAVPLAGTISEEFPTRRILSAETLEDGAVATWYGDVDPSNVAEEETADGSDLSKRCGTNQLRCSTADGAEKRTCERVVAYVRGNRQGIPSAPRDICIQEERSRCCISWANPVRGGIKDNLTSAAQKVLNSCWGNGQFSGLTRDTLIGSTCTTQCLSNNPGHCRN